MLRQGLILLGVTVGILLLFTTTLLAVYNRFAGLDRLWG